MLRGPRRGPKALYEWNYKKQLLRIQATSGAKRGRRPEDDIFTDEFLLATAAADGDPATEPVVLLIDEIDKVEVEVEALMLEVLSDFQVTIPELGTMAGARAGRRSSSPPTPPASCRRRCERRCLYLRLDYPTPSGSATIVLSQVPGLYEELARPGWSPWSRGFASWS